MGFRYITAVEPKQATGLVANVYRQQAADVGLARMPALMVLSPVPHLLAATWSMLRESLLAGPVSRTEREIVALGVSMANQCPYCVGAHTMFLHAIGDHRLAETLMDGGRPDDPRQAELFAWALGEPAETPDTPELLATALTFHFINRMVTVLHTPDVLPGGLQRNWAMRVLGGRMLAKPAKRRLVPGQSLPLLRNPAVPPDTAACRGAGSGTGWARGSSAGTAFAALTTVAAEGAALLPDPERVHETVTRWNGAHPPMDGAWLAYALAGLPPAAVPPTRLAILAALAPYRITDADVADWPHSGADLVRLLAYGTITAVRHAERSFTAAGVQG